MTAGQAVEAMACNRLTSPAPLAHVQDWARDWAAPEIPGVPAVALNDDKPGRTAVRSSRTWRRSPRAPRSARSPGFGIGISRLHWDMTGFSPHSTCDQADEDYPAPRCGHPRDRREDLPQIQAGIAAAGDGGIPACHRACDGGAAEVSQVSGAMTALKKIAGTRTFLLIGDSKLISCDNVAAAGGQGCTFPAPAPRTHVKAAGLAACDLAPATGAEHVAGRDPGKRPDQTGRRHVPEDTAPFEIRDSKRKSDPSIVVRRVFVRPTAPAGAAAASRARKLTRASDDLNRLVSGLGGRLYPGEQAATGRLKQISTARKAGPCPRHTTGTIQLSSTAAATGTTKAAGVTGTAGAGSRHGSGSGGPGKPALTWWSGQDATDAEAATDGWYALTANLGTQVAPAEVLLRHQGHEAAERRYGNLNGPLAAAPLFLHSNRKIAALITAISLALLVFCLIEREARRNLAPQTKIDGPHNRQPARPAGRLILTTLAGLRLIPATGTTPAQITRPSPVQARLLELPGVDPTRPH